MAEKTAVVDKDTRYLRNLRGMKMVDSELRERDEEKYREYLKSGRILHFIMNTSPDATFEERGTRATTMQGQGFVLQARTACALL